MSTYDAVKDLPLEIESYELEPLEQEVARGFTLRRTTVVLRGGGEEGRGEEVDYDPDAQQRFQARRGELPFAGRHTLDSFSVLQSGADRVPPLGVRVGSARPGAAAGRDARSARPSGATRSRSASSSRPASRTSRAGARSIRTCISSSTPTAEWSDETISSLATAGVVDTVDFKGIYRAEFGSAARPRALRAHRRRVPGGVDRGPGADPGDAGRARAAPRAHHVGCGDPRVERRRGAAVPPTLPQLASRRASDRSRRLFDFYDACEREGIGLYGGGQYELGPGRDQIQLLASLFHADAPNDVAPGGFNASEPVTGLPAPPLSLSPRPGFRV